MTEREQGRTISRALPALAAMRQRYRVSAMWWYTWLSPQIGDDESFSYSGLRRVGSNGEPVAKPALRAFSSTAKRLQRGR